MVSRCSQNFSEHSCDVAHIAGITGGAYVAALNYVKDRDQFGKKISQFQIIQKSKKYASK